MSKGPRPAPVMVRLSPRWSLSEGGTGLASEHVCGGTVLRLLRAAPFPGQGNLNDVKVERAEQNRASEGAPVHSFLSALDCAGNVTSCLKFLLSSLPYCGGL